VSFHPADDTPSDDAAAAGFTEAPDVLYTRLLRNAGYRVDRILTSSAPDAEVLNAYDVVIISRSVPSSDYQDAGGTAWNGITAPAILMGGYPNRSSRMGLATGTSLADTTESIRLAVSDPAHPVFAGIPLDGAGTMVNTFADVVSFNETLQRGISVTMDPLAGEGTVLATVATETDAAFGGVIVGEWAPGGTMGNAAADTLAGPRLAFLSGSREQEITSQGSGIFDLTPTGTRMLLNAVAYMAAMETSPTGPVIESIELVDGQVVITWQGGETLQGANAVTGPWTDIAGATSPYSEAPEGDYTFYRLMQ
jgi:hypothetical protein